MSEEAVKEIIEQVGYQEFYRYFQEKTTLIEQQRREIERLKGALQTHEILLQSNTKEIERLNNIINELDNWFKEKDYNGFEKFYVEDALYKLQELKGSNINENL